MTREPITSKAQMYRLLASGRLGNTIPMYFDVDAWEASGDAGRFAVWGVRTLTPGGPCRLYCPREEVRATALSFAPHPVNVSVMVDAVCTVTLMADVWEGPEGLEVYGIDLPPKGANWRRDMPGMGRTYRLTAARTLLRKRLSADDLDDLRDLLDLYPGHAVELSACDRPVGALPGRLAVVWEVRDATTGLYERDAWRRPG